MWFSKILEHVGLTESTSYEVLVVRVGNVIAPANSALGPERDNNNTKQDMRWTVEEVGFVKKDPTERLASKEHDRDSHIEEAPRVDFPLLTYGYLD